MSLSKYFLTQFIKRTALPLWRMVELSLLEILGVFFFFVVYVFC